MSDDQRIEAVARAICEANGHDPDGPTCDVYVPDDPDAGKPWAGFRYQARATIAALDDARDAEIKRLRQISRENLQTLAAERERCKRWGKPHHEIDTAIRDTRTALNGGYEDD